MNLEDNLISILSCAVSSDNHFIEKPIPLSCGHAICKKCIPINDENNIEQILCGICNKLNKSDLNVVEESLIIKNLVSLNLDKLFGMVKKRFEESLYELKGLLYK